MTSSRLEEEGRSEIGEADLLHQRHRHARRPGHVHRAPGSRPCALRRQRPPTSPAAAAPPISTRPSPPHPPAHPCSPGPSTNTPSTPTRPVPPGRRSRPTRRTRDRASRAGPRPDHFDPGHRRPQHLAAPRRSHTSADQPAISGMDRPRGGHRRASDASPMGNVRNAATRPGRTRPPRQRPTGRHGRLTDGPVVQARALDTAAAAALPRQRGCRCGEGGRPARGPCWRPPMCCWRKTFLGRSPGHMLVPLCRRVVGEAAA